jgi:tetratricopeptide (TPR) repeat protein
MMGSIEYELGNYEKAWEHFSSYSQKYPKGPLSIEAEKSLGYILEQQGKHQDAIEKFKSLEDKISSTRKAEIQLAIARNYEVLQNVDEAVTTYQVIVDSNTTFSWKDKARERLAILRPEKVTPSAETPEETPAAEEQQEGETKEGQPAGEKTTTETSEESPEEQPAPETTEEPAAEQPSGTE